MKLLNCQTFELRSFLPNEIPEYVILSHRWGPEEVTYRDISKNTISDHNSPARHLGGFSKVEGVCRLASNDGYSWVWIDSCCIDKESSSDVDKNINSMWAYYTKSNICYVYMADVPDAAAGWSTSFEKSNWFTRGWTLQELVAPVHVEFYAADWSPIGTKLERHTEIAQITSIDEALLAQNKSIDGYTAAECLSWAAHRQVTQEEDEAYSLLGLFQIHMPMLYGEGRSRAFARLQEQIYLATCDDSIFLFRYSIYNGDQPLIADCTSRFCQRANCGLCERHAGGAQTFPSESQIPYSTMTPSEHWKHQPHEQMITTVTSFRNEMSVPLIIVDYKLVSGKLIFFGDKQKQNWRSHVAILNHTMHGYEKGAFCLFLYRPEDSIEPCFYRLSHYPALLPDISEIETTMEKSKILVVGPPIKKVARQVKSIFSVSGDGYKVLAWNAKLVDARETLAPAGNLNSELKNAEFRVQAKETWSKRRAEVSCKLLCHQGSKGKLQIIVELEKIDEMQSWSIKQVTELNPRGRSRGRRKSFLPSTPSDRCKLHLTSKDILYVGIRRTATGNGSGEHGSILQQRYNIFIRPTTGSNTSIDRMSE